MPKLLKSPEDKNKRVLQSNINYLSNLQGVTEKNLKATARLSDYQYRERKKDPGKYTYDELLKIAKKFHTTVAELTLERSG